MPDLETRHNGVQNIGWVTYIKTIFHETSLSFIYGNPLPHLHDNGLFYFFMVFGNNRYTDVFL